jgi:membrane-associated HD superfamily phosphohydrolase
MFIPRTLAQDDPRAGRGLGRALIVTVLVALALFLVLSANITVGQENLAVGEIAPRDIRAQRDATFTSDSRTEELRAQAADEVAPVTETVKSPTDNQEDQLLAYDTMVRRVARVLCATAGRSRATRSSTDCRTMCRSSPSPGGSRSPTSTPFAGRRSRRPAAPV